MTKPAKQSAALYVLGKLSDRETEVFKRIAQGETVAHIGKVLGLTHSSVSTYRRRVLVKLRQHSNADLTMIAQRLGIVEVPEF